MNLARCCILPLICTAVAFPQSSDLFDKAPPEIDEALRARVMIFYGAHISGKYRDALKVVADDAMDDFLAGNRDSYTACEVSKINYSDNFSKAAVTTACKGEMRFRGTRMPVTMPLLSTWKVVDGEWFWYHIKQDSVVTPFGISRAFPGDAAGSTPAPAIPADPMAAAQNILKMVSIDGNAVQLKGYEASKGELHVVNNMPGNVTVTVDKLPVAGTHVQVTPSELGSKDKATIVFSYDPNDPSITCSECTAKVALPTLTANVRILPTGQVFPVKVTFAIPPEQEKLLPKPPAVQK